MTRHSNAWKLKDKSCTFWRRSRQNGASAHSSHFPSPRLRGLYDVHGPGCANQDSLQTTADFSSLSLVELSIYGRDHEVVWEDDDDEEALLCPPADETVGDHAGCGDGLNQYRDQLDCLASPIHLVPSSSGITFNAQGCPLVPDSTNDLLIMFART